MRMRFGWLLMTCVVPMGFAACGDASNAGDGVDDDPGPNPNEPQTPQTVQNPLAVAFPQQVAIASPVRSNSNDTRRQGIVVRQSLGADAAGGYADKTERLQAILDGTTVEDCAFEFDLRRRGPVADCYGPRLTYANHPQAPSPDANTTDDDSGFTDTDGDGELPSGDLGLWRSTEGTGGEACAAATMNARVGEVEAQADSALFAMASMLCLANVSGESLPADGSGLDITTLVADGFSVNGTSLTVSTASISLSDGVYTSFLEGSGSSSGVAERYRCRLKHRDGANGVTYTGKLSCTIEADTGMKHGNCNQPELATGETDALSIAYQRNSASILTYELRSANYCGSTGIDPWVSNDDYTVDAGRKLNLSRDPGDDDLSGWANNFNHVRFQFNVNTGGGLYNFAWQAGTRDGHTRILNLEMDSQDQEGNHEGCGYFGFGDDISDEDDYGDIEGMICNWAGPGHSMPRDPAEAVQRQCFVLDTASGVYRPDSARENLVYAPTNSCDSAGFDGLGNPFTYTDGMTTVTGSVAHDLFPVADMPSVVAPAPGNVDSP